MTVGDSSRLGLGRAIELRRVQMGLKRKDLAALAQLSYPYVSELENGAKEPSAKALRQLADALQLGVADLMALGERSGSPDSSQIELPPFDPIRQTASTAPEMNDAAVRPTPDRVGSTHSADAASAAGPGRPSADLIRELVDQAISEYARTVLPPLVERLVDEALGRRAGDERT